MSSNIAILQMYFDSSCPPPLRFSPAVCAVGCIGSCMLQSPDDQVPVMRRYDGRPLKSIGAAVGT